MFSDSACHGYFPHSILMQKEPQLPQSRMELGYLGGKIDSKGVSILCPQENLLCYIHIISFLHPEQVIMVLRSSLTGMPGKLVRSRRISSGLSVGRSPTTMLLSSIVLDLGGVKRSEMQRKMKMLGRRLKLWTSAFTPKSTCIL